MIITIITTSTTPTTINITTTTTAANVRESLKRIKWPTVIRITRKTENKSIKSSN